MGRRKASEHGLSPGIWVRVPIHDNYRIRQLVAPGRPLGVVMRELVLAGLEKREKGGSSEAPPLQVTA